MNNILNETEVEKIEAFVKDKVALEAVRKVLLQGIYQHGVLKAGEKHDPLVNGAFALAATSMNNPVPDELLGQHIRAMWAGVNALKNAFDTLESIKAPIKTATPSPFNVAE